MKTTPRSIQVFDLAYVDEAGKQLAERSDGVSGWAITANNSRHGVVFSQVVNGWVGNGSYIWLAENGSACATLVEVKTRQDLKDAA